MKWRIKIIVKILLSKLPIPYSIWKLLGLFKHGKMDSYDYAIKIFNLHFRRAYPTIVPKNIQILELGPGDSIAAGIIGYANGVKKTYLIDIDNYATKNLNFYKNLAKILKFKGFNVPNLDNVSCFEDILKVTNTIYLHEGLKSLKNIKSNSIDFIWSHSVLEHVRKSNFVETQK